MTKRRKLHSADPDKAAAHADTRWIHYVYGQGTPRNQKLANAKREELRRVLENLATLEHLDKLESWSLLPMPLYPRVMRAATVRKA